MNQQIVLHINLWRKSTCCQPPFEPCTLLAKKCASCPHQWLLPHLPAASVCQSQHPQQRQCRVVMWETRLFYRLKETWWHRWHQKVFQLHKQSCARIIDHISIHIYISLHPINYTSMIYSYEYWIHTLSRFVSACVFAQRSVCQKIQSFWKLMGRWVQ